MPAAYFAVRPARDRLMRRRWRWALVAPNGEVIATSEIYNSEAAARYGAEAVARYASTAEVRRFRLEEQD